MKHFCNPSCAEQAGGGSHTAAVAQGRENSVEKPLLTGSSVCLPLSLHRNLAFFIFIFHIPFSPFLNCCIIMLINSQGISAAYIFMTAPRTGSNYFNAELQEMLQSKGRGRPYTIEQAIIIMPNKSHPSSFPMVFTNLSLHALFLFFQILIFLREHYWYKFHILIQFIFSSYFYFLLHIHICKNKNFKSAWSAFPSEAWQTNDFISRSAEHPVAPAEVSRRNEMLYSSENRIIYLLTS